MRVATCSDARGVATVGVLDDWRHRARSDLSEQGVGSQASFGHKPLEGTAHGRHHNLNLPKYMGYGAVGNAL